MAVVAVLFEPDSPVDDLPNSVPKELGRIASRREEGPLRPLQLDGDPGAPHRVAVANQEVGLMLGPESLMRNEPPSMTAAEILNEDFWGFW
jgi:hypothetical protein